MWKLPIYRANIKIDIEIDSLPQAYNSWPLLSVQLALAQREKRRTRKENKSAAEKGNRIAFVRSLPSLFHCKPFQSIVFPAAWLVGYDFLVVEFTLYHAQQITP